MIVDGQVQREMNPAEAKKKVIDAGKKLSDTGLIARTWGNVSCRISPEQFVITPSGLPYEMLTPAEIVTVNIKDCSYEGALEPSSEKWVHAEVYRRRPEINFVIHTHQPYASAVSPLKTDLDVNDPVAEALIGKKVVSVAYGLPGTKKLRRNVASAVSRIRGKAYLMASHGALCLGKDSDEAFRVAGVLEHICTDFINRRYLELSGKTTADPAEVRNYFVKLQTGNNSSGSQVIHKQYFNSERTGDGFRIHLDTSENRPFLEGSGRVINVPLNKESTAVTGGKLPAGAEIHQEIYRNFEEIQAVIHTVTPDIFAVSQTGKTVYPLLDDFAQLIGTSVQVADPASFDNPGSRARGISRKLKGRSAVMIKGNGALCCGPTKSDAAAAVTVMDKNCKAVIVSALFGRGKPINSLECKLMRYIYLNRYSKKAVTKQTPNQ